MSDFISGRKKSEKERKRETLSRNREKGKMGERIIEQKYRLKGYVMDGKHPKGGDMTVRKRDILTGKLGPKKLVEVKSGPTARLSKLQVEIKKKKKTKVERVNPNLI